MIFIARWIAWTKGYSAGETIPDNVNFDFSEAVIPSVRPRRAPLLISILPDRPVPPSALGTAALRVSRPGPEGILGHGAGASLRLQQKPGIPHMPGNLIASSANARVPARLRNVDVVRKPIG